MILSGVASAAVVAAVYGLYAGGRAFLSHCARPVRSVPRRHRHGERLSLNFLSSCPKFFVAKMISPIPNFWFKSQVPKSIPFPFQFGSQNSKVSPSFQFTPSTAPRSGHWSGAARSGPGSRIPRTVSTGNRISLIPFMSSNYPFFLPPGSDTQVDTVVDSPESQYPVTSSGDAEAGGDRISRGGGSSSYADAQETLYDSNLRRKCLSFGRALISLIFSRPQHFPFSHYSGARHRGPNQDPGGDPGGHCLALGRPQDQALCPHCYP